MPGFLLNLGDQTGLVSLSEEKGNYTGSSGRALTGFIHLCHLRGQLITPCLSKWRKRGVKLIASDHLMSQGETLGSFSLHCLQISQGKRKKNIYFSWLQCIAYGNIYALELAQVLSPPRHGAVGGRHPVKFNHVWFPWPLE